MDLTPDQNKAHDKIMAWATRDDGNLVMTLQGYAGTGKSTLVQEIAAHFGADIALTAPTNKATKVLRKMATDRGLKDVRCLTIQSANKLRMMDDAPEKYLTKGGASDFDSFKLIVVDEASMVGQWMAEQILEEAQLHNTKVLFVGDPLQLLPVKDGDHAAFSAGIPQVKLTQIVRQAEGNPILQLGAYFRGLLDGRIHQTEDVPLSVNADGEGVHEILKRFSSRFVEAVVGQNHYDDNRAIAWTNVAVNSLAAKARHGKYHDAGYTFVAGERVYTAAPVKDGGETAVMYTDQEATVVEVGEAGAHPSYTSHDAIPVRLESDDGDKVYVWLPPLHEKEAIEARASDLRERAMKLTERSRESREAWKDFHDFRDAWADIRSVHALTAHRSQGSTFENVWVDLRDIAGCRNPKERWRLLYVACTRARRNVYLRR